MTKRSKREPKTPTSSPALRVIVSVLIVFHLAAIFIAPLMLATNGSPAVAPFYEALEPYYGVTSTDHGYAFFAPNPPFRNSLVRYRVEFDDGREPIEHTFPDIERHWPRLLYHRHFMLSEQLAADFSPPKPPPGAPPELVDAWKLRRGPYLDWDRRRPLYEVRWKSFEQHLLAQHDGDRVTMIRMWHLVPDQAVFEEFKDLQHPDSYVDLDEFEESVLPADLSPTGETIP